MQTEVINGVVGFLTDFFWNQFLAWFAGIVFAIILFFIKPSISFKLAKATFGWRHRQKTLNFSLRSTFRLPGLHYNFDQLLKELEQLDNFSSVGEHVDNGDRRIQLQCRVDGQDIELQMLPIINDDNIIEGLRMVHKSTITYSGIEDFIDVSVGGRDLVFNAITQISIIPISLPSLVVNVTWKSSHLSILSWLKDDYQFDGAITIEGTEISLRYNKEGVSIKAPSPTTKFKDILKTMIVDNLTK
ncbi:MAG: hypothetical protein ACW968_07620 [Candidatus Thorarchaeota archaeon]|jgi:hypothetical protein